MADARDTLQSTFGGAYTIERELGGGDTTLMYRQVDRCAEGPTGQSGLYGTYPEMLKRFPVFAPYRQQPHFKRHLDTIRLAGPHG